MSKTSGLGANCYVGGYDLSGDVGSLSSIGGGIAVEARTGIDKYAIERGALIRDGRIEYATFFNPANAHVALAPLPASDQPVTYAHGTTIGDPAASLVGRQINYDGTRGADGSLNFAVQALANGTGLEWGRMLTPGVASISSAGAQAGLDYGASPGSTAFGMQAYLHVFAFSGTSATVTIQDSANGSDWLDLTGGGFTAATGAGSQRLLTARDATVRRHLRVNVTGTFSALSFAVAAKKNLATVLF